MYENALVRISIAKNKPNIMSMRAVIRAQLRCNCDRMVIANILPISMNNAIFLYLFGTRRVVKSFVPTAL